MDIRQSDLIRQRLMAVMAERDAPAVLLYGLGHGHRRSHALGVRRVRTPCREGVKLENHLVTADGVDRMTNYPFCEALLE